MVPEYTAGKSQPGRWGSCRLQVLAQSRVFGPSGSPRVGANLSPIRAVARVKATAVSAEPGSTWKTFRENGKEFSRLA